MFIQDYWNQLPNWMLCSVLGRVEAILKWLVSLPATSTKFQPQNTVEVYECQVNNKKEIKLSLNYFRLSRTATALMVHSNASHHIASQQIRTNTLLYFGTANPSYLVCLPRAFYFRMCIFRWCSSLGHIALASVVSVSGCMLFTL